MREETPSLQTASDQNDQTCAAPSARLYWVRVNLLVYALHGHRLTELKLPIREPRTVLWNSRGNARQRQLSKGGVFLGQQTDQPTQTPRPYCFSRCPS